ncbi:Imm44 family immunity protein [Alteromonas sp. H39]|uniref:Imm44 family immunity protein n=1 Tax=Alteromonas sp. H39 TaxID=3389876 RepID=UPI0039DFE081
MKFVLSGEIDESVSKQFQKASSVVQLKLEDFLSERDYGSEVNELNIIPIIVDIPEEMEKQGWYKERKLFRRATHSSDFRLRISYKDFLNGNDEQRISLLIDNIITAIDILSTRAKKDFDHASLKRDILSRFDKCF